MFCTEQKEVLRISFFYLDILPSRNVLVTEHWMQLNYTGPCTNARNVHQKANQFHCTTQILLYENYSVIDNISWNWLAINKSTKIEEKTVQLFSNKDTCTN